MNSQVFWKTPTVLESIKEQPEDDEGSIDIESTDGESESDYSATESDKEFIVSDYLGHGQDEDESEYEPPDVEADELSDSTDEDEDDSIETEILNKRIVYRQEGPVTQYMVKFWVDEDHIPFLSEYMRACQESDGVGLSGQKQRSFPQPS
ncbi:hypothetical protein N7474_010105 [Penicillium riverlandense]|uniref:uncharacterized protein n=1 Tax=Penicillium riverlandense TaxID=1903569 RepID=UPI002548DC8F|nr:uncharacterized protein N7474_010105 [Penicillium riverlandense]KAJ5808836.1 hypothetical protein N7474_010105 [Penicillium riverlandense]